MEPLEQVLIRMAEHRWPDEACGAVLRRPSGVLVARELRNIAPGPRLRFEVDPGELARLLTSEGQEALVAFWHSHRGAARPSASDRDEAAAPDGTPLWPQVRSVVVGMSDGRATGVHWTR